MCDKCREIVECPIDDTRAVLIEKDDETIRDYYDHVLTDCGLWIDISKYGSGYAKAKIGRYWRDENGIYNSIAIDIRHCPYCGEKLY